MDKLNILPNGPKPVKPGAAPGKLGYPGRAKGPVKKIQSFLIHYIRYNQL